MMGDKTMADNMNESLHPAASHLLPSFISASGETNVFSRDDCNPGFKAPRCAVPLGQGADLDQGPEQESAGLYAH